MDYQPNYQPTGQPAGQPVNQPTDQPTEQQGSSNKVWYVIAALVIIALALWYFYAKQAPSAGTLPPSVGQEQMAPLSSGNTTADISSDLSQIPDSSAALGQDAAASAQAVQGL